MRAAILLGAPGAGKGTIAQAVCERSPFLHVSTGDMLREAIQADAPVGHRAAGYMQRGELVPDEVILDVVRERMRAADPAAGLLFDGFPRTEAQARGLDALLAEQRAQLVRVVLLDVPRPVLVDRLSGRRICRSCGAVFHVRNIPPRREGICDACGGELVQRPDDSEATVLNRLEVYRQQTESLIRYYEERGQLLRLDASGDRHATAQEVVRCLEP